jgi:hypothetical protein
MTMADVVGLLVLAVETAIVVVVFSYRSNPVITFVIAFLVLAVTALYLWRSEKSPRAAKGWIFFALGSIVVGTLFFAVDIWSGHSAHPNLPLIDAGLHNDGFWGFGWTLIVCPGLTMIAIAGAARTLYLNVQKIQ